MNQHTEDAYKEKKNKGGMRKIKKFKKFSLIFISFCLLNIITILSTVNAVNINSQNIISGGDCGSLLKYKGIVVKAYYAQYVKDGVSYPAYCLDKTKQGVDDSLSYSVSVQEAITDVKLWRIIINGYPYKSIQELGCSNKEEAFTATKQAIYCYIHGNNPNDYEAIGEAGKRTLNALNKILKDAQNCNETQISNNIKINRGSESFKVDSKNKNYVSKTYSIKAGAPITNYKVSLLAQDGQLPEGIKITDLNNNSKQEFSQNEEFKILIPIKNLKDNGSFKINIKTQIKNKPVLYGKAENSAYQDYALTAATYEDATGITEDNYYKNETKIKIIKQDKDTKVKLEGVEFNLLDKDKKVIHANLKTNKNGEVEISNLLPGKYYIKETNAKDGYIISEDLVELNVEFNQNVIVTINNKFKEKTEIKIEQKEESATIDSSKTNTSEKSIINMETELKESHKKLPVTGM